VLDEDAPVHRHGNAGPGEPLGRLFVHDALLHEEKADASGDGLVRHRTHELRAPEHVHDVDPDVPGNLGQGRVARPSEQLAVPRVDREDVVALLDQVPGDGMRGACGIGRAAHDRHGAGRTERSLDLLRVVQWLPPSWPFESSGRRL